MPGFLKTETGKYTLFGFLFGAAFPVIANTIYALQNDVSFITAILSLDPILLIVNTAPIVLGSVFFVLGKKQDQLRSAQFNSTAVKKAMEDAEYLAQFAKLNPNPILKLSSAGEILYANEASMPIFLHLDCQLGDKVTDNWLDIVTRVLDTQMAEEIEIEEGLGTFKVLFVPVPEHDYINIYGRDITREKLLEKERSDAERKQAVSAMVTTYNHEIRNPLMIALGNIPRGDSEKDTKRIGKLRTALDRISEIVKEIAKITEGEVEFSDYADSSAMVQLGSSSPSNSDEKTEATVSAPAKAVLSGKILVVDDEPEMVELLSEELEDREFETVTASGGFAAIEILDEQKDIDFVVTDANMPEGSGLQLLKHMKTNSIDIPIAFVTAFSGTVCDEAKQNGAIAVFTKPLNYDALISTITQALEAKKKGQAA